MFIIINSLLPTQKNLSNLTPLKTILPGIDRIYTTDNKNNEKNETTTSIKFLEIIQKYVIH